MDLMKWISLQNKVNIVPPIPKSIERMGWVEGPLYDLFFDNEPAEGDTKLSFVDPFDITLDIPDDSLMAATVDPDTNLVHIPLDDGDLKLMFFALKRSVAPSEKADADRESERPSLGMRKAKQIGEIIGTLVRNKDGRVAAVTDLGRVTWLSQDVEGPK